MNIKILYEYNDISDKLQKLGFRVDVNSASKEVGMNHIVYNLKELKKLNIKIVLIDL